MDILILALATWRIASLLANEDGPFDVFERLRLAVGAYYDEYGQRLGGNELARGLLCCYCSSIWIGFALMIIYSVDHSIALALSTPLALSTAAIVILSYIEKEDSS